MQQQQKRKMRVNRHAPAHVQTRNNYMDVYSKMSLTVKSTQKTALIEALFDSLQRQKVSASVEEIKRVKTGFFTFPRV